MTFNTYATSQTIPAGAVLGLKCAPPPGGMTLTLQGQEGEIVYAFNANADTVAFLDSLGANFGINTVYELTQQGQAVVLIFTGGQWWVMGEFV